MDADRAPVFDVPNDHGSGVPDHHGAFIIPVPRIVRLGCGGLGRERAKAKGGKAEKAEKQLTHVVVSFINPTRAPICNRVASGLLSQGCYQ
jgi:hypothetical protein